MRLPADGLRRTIHAPFGTIARFQEMRISVHSRCSRRGSEPCSIYLGQAQLRVTAILERRDLADADYFEVRVLDGRKFVLSHERGTDSWKIGAVYPRTMRQCILPPVPVVRIARPRSRFFARCGKAFTAFAHAWRVPSS